MKIKSPLFGYGVFAQVQIKRIFRKTEESGFRGEFFKAFFDVLKIAPGIINGGHRQQGGEKRGGFLTQGVLDLWDGGFFLDFFPVFFFFGLFESLASFTLE